MDSILGTYLLDHPEQNLTVNVLWGDYADGTHAKLDSCMPVSESTITATVTSGLSAFFSSSLSGTITITARFEASLVELANGDVLVKVQWTATSLGPPSVQRTGPCMVTRLRKSLLGQILPVVMVSSNTYRSYLPTSQIQSGFTIDSMQLTGYTFSWTDSGWVLVGSYPVTVFYQSPLVNLGDNGRTVR